MKDKKLLYAYMAGFVDADGSISIISMSQKKRFTVRITVSNCNYDIISLFTTEFGGKVREKKGRKKNWKVCYEWSLTSNKALAVIQTLYPFLRIKQGQADLTIELQQLRLKMKSEGIHHRWHKEKWDAGQTIMQQLKDKCMSLNKRGVA